jgi:hypothetical protein
MKRSSKIVLTGILLASVTACANEDQQKKECIDKTTYDRVECTELDIRYSGGRLMSFEESKRDPNVELERQLSQGYKETPKASQPTTHAGGFTYIPLILPQPYYSPYYGGGSYRPSSPSRSYAPSPSYNAPRPSAPTTPSVPSTGGFGSSGRAAVSTGGSSGG